MEYFVTNLQIAAILRSLTLKGHDVSNEAGLMEELFENHCGHLQDSVDPLIVWVSANNLDWIMRCKQSEALPFLGDIALALDDCAEPFNVGM
ncbi:protein kinase [Vibrio phage VAP7]|uniref:Protein kinase n=1 Tax=Vibrio phage VAP7 TaxID=2584487 RepID=A0A4Y5TX68_9CAUD|nr:protein kinase [Vibrio phage VAP7]QDB73236.1 protein kinase [Vibrio phage VAP7]